MQTNTCFNNIQTVIMINWSNERHHTECIEAITQNVSTSLNAFLLNCAFNPDISAAIVTSQKQHINEFVKFLTSVSQRVVHCSLVTDEIQTNILMIWCVVLDFALHTDAAIHSLSILQVLTAVILSSFKNYTFNHCKPYSAHHHHQPSSFY